MGENPRKGIASSRQHAFRTGQRNQSDPQQEAQEEADRGGRGRQGFQGQAGCRQEGERRNGQEGWREGTSYHRGYQEERQEIGDERFDSHATMSGNAMNIST